MVFWEYIIISRQVTSNDTIDLLRLYKQVRFQLIYGSELSYLTVHLYEKARKDESFDMKLKQEIKKVMVGHEKKCTFKQE